MKISVSIIDPQTDEQVYFAKTSLFGSETYDEKQRRALVKAIIYKLYGVVSNQFNYEYQDESQTLFVTSRFNQHVTKKEIAKIDESMTDVINEIGIQHVLSISTTVYKD